MPSSTQLPAELERHRVHSRWSLKFAVMCVSWLIVCLPSANLCGQDTVVVRSKNGSGKTSKILGKVVDISGKELRLKSGDQVRTLKSDRVVHIYTRRTPAQGTGDRLLAEKNYRSATEQYGIAYNEEKRDWVRREILANLVWSSGGLNRPDLAGRYFIELTHSDPETIHFGCIPLKWDKSESAPTESIALSWLRTKDSSAGLLGASFLLAGPHRGEAIERLSRLRTDTNRRVALLASAQLWRTRIVTASKDDLVAWEQTIRRMPTDLRGGPWFVLGMAHQHQKKYVSAATALMRVPIFHARHRRRAALALWSAANILERGGGTDQAGSLYREIVREYGELPIAQKAKRQLTEKNRSK